MTDRSPYPDIADDTGAGPDRASTTWTPLWVWWLGSSCSARLMVNEVVYPDRRDRPTVLTQLPGTSRARPPIAPSAGGAAVAGEQRRIALSVAADYPFEVAEISLHSEQGRALTATQPVLFAPGILLDGEPFGYRRLSERKLRRHLARE